eukprot:CAMPEP_0183761638 /NCGR_PEP_ID=MMETSP0739-20130205/8556_1 /TAXON_ID=385413 /ORGANISM="Thalassiosira miniscula, Strain CCMP1093" /LENGTH=238 /DNA_ID=CAMNT_0025999819 /DNA_START=387 /DNA_END=1100 /DNA_ORIENTATION=+
MKFLTAIEVLLGIGAVYSKNAKKKKADIGILPRKNSPSIRRLDPQCPPGVDAIECIDGVTPDGISCEEACGGKCCTPAGSCSRRPLPLSNPGFTGTVCADDYSCMGHLSCSGAKIKLVSNSCYGKLACEYVENRNDGNAGPMVDSCNGYKACQYMAYGSAADVVGMLGSCNGYKACYYAAAMGSIGGSIGYLENSCNAKKACYKMAYFDGTIHSMLDSCNSPAACESAAMNHGYIGPV